MTSANLDTPELKAIAIRARHRRNLMLLTFLPTAVVLGVVVGALIGRHHGPTHHQHVSTAAAVAALVVGGIVLLAEAAFLVYLVRHRKGLFGPQLILGLKYRDRRTVMKALRSGQPPADETLRTVGLVMAERTITYRRLTLATFVVAGLGQILNAALPERPAPLRVLYLIFALSFVALFWYQRLVLAGARRYVAQTTNG
ncbi:hypothetical protein M6D93_11065 [Jatrophihabitans telluris]|uniref:Uncharacterized protein n=1 Tax=Jatrophihabitans telluris TaxID=2038343 RepID=A0ABY4QUU4_9ACTN|nr:hypothetical protein [Jatrophihabitans telluris]UQX86847.1 hypothetical protein M6D93_11065 [Jatrophihabitans telluris]